MTPSSLPPSSLLSIYKNVYWLSLFTISFFLSPVFPSLSLFTNHVYSDKVRGFCATIASTAKVEGAQEYNEMHAGLVELAKVVGIKFM